MEHELYFLHAIYFVLQKIPMQLDGKPFYIIFFKKSYVNKKINIAEALSFLQVHPPYVTKCLPP